MASGLLRFARNDGRARDPHPARPIGRVALPTRGRETHYAQPFFIRHPHPFPYGPKGVLCRLYGGCYMGLRTCPRATDRENKGNIR